MFIIYTLLNRHIYKYVELNNGLIIEPNGLIIIRCPLGVSIVGRCLAGTQSEVVLITLVL